MRIEGTEVGKVQGDDVMAQEEPAPSGRGSRRCRLPLPERPDMDT